jgi:hypothetical protein
MSMEAGPDLAVRRPAGVIAVPLFFRGCSKKDVAGWRVGE